MKKVNIEKIKAIYQKIVTGFTILLFGLTIYILVAGTIAMKNGTMMNIFGYTYSVVPTPSMEPEIHVGDSVVGKKVSYDSLEIGDDVIYHYVTDKLDIYIVHRIIYKDDVNGFKTKGINNAVEDDGWVTKDNFQSKVVWHGNLANIGTLVINYRGAIFLVLVLVLLLVAANGVFDIIKTVQESKEEPREEIKEIDVEAENEKWRAELRKQVEEEIKQEQKNNQDGN